MKSEFLQLYLQKFRNGSAYSNMNIYLEFAISNEHHIGSSILQVNGDVNCHKLFRQLSLDWKEDFTE